MAAAVAIALPIDGDNEIEPNWDQELPASDAPGWNDEFVWEPTDRASEVETVDAFAVICDFGVPADFAATPSDAELSAKQHRGSTIEPTTLYFPGGRRFLAVELEIDERGFEPLRLFDVPKVERLMQWRTEIFLAPDSFISREQAIAKAAEENVATLQALAADDSDSAFDWWIVVEVGENHLPGLFSFDLSGDVGTLTQVGPSPVRIVRPTADEVESIERDALLYDLAGEEGGVA